MAFKLTATTSDKVKCEDEMEEKNAISKATDSDTLLTLTQFTSLYCVWQLNIDLICNRVLQLRSTRAFRTAYFIPHLYNITPIDAIKTCDYDAHQPTHTNISRR